MMDLNTKLVLGFLIWSAFSIILIIVERYRAWYWKRAAHTMECHAASLQKLIDCTPPERMERPWDSIPSGVIVHPDGPLPLHDADEPTLIDIMALGKQGSCHDDSE